MTSALPANITKFLKTLDEREACSVFRTICSPAIVGLSDDQIAMRLSASSLVRTDKTKVHHMPSKHSYYMKEIISIDERITNGFGVQGKFTGKTRLESTPKEQYVLLGSGPASSREIILIKCEPSHPSSAVTYPYDDKSKSLEINNAYIIGKYSEYTDMYAALKVLEPSLFVPHTQEFLDTLPKGIVEHLK